MEKIKVLLIEDDDDDYLITRDLLAEIDPQRFALAWAADYDAALQKIAVASYDVCLLDYRLGAQDGLALLRQARAMDFDAPVILLTGQPDLEIDLQAMKAGAADYLVKGQLDAAALERSIRYTIQQKRLEEERLKLFTERQAREQAEAANRAKDDFLAMLAHELRNPLAPIRNAVEVLKRRGMPDGETQWARGVIERQTHHLSRLVDDLLDVSRVTQGKVRLEKEPVEMATVIARAVETSRPLIDSRHHELFVSLPQEPAYVEGDVIRLAQVVSNLLNNAAKYTEDGGKIWLSATVEAESLIVRVRDTGVGISPEEMAQVFNLFSQSTRSLDRSKGGLGIGLTLVRNLVELHGGSVEAYSAGIGQGSEFTVRLPLTTAAAASARSQTTTQKVAAPTTAKRILIVDDNEDAAESMALLLTFDGHQAQMAHDGLTALKLAQSFQPEVILLDIGLPGMNGYDVARRLRGQAETSAAQLIAMTGYGQEEDRERSKEAGFDFHLVKPVEPETLQQLLNSMPAAAAPHSL